LGVGGSVSVGWRGLADPDSRDGVGGAEEMAVGRATRGVGVGGGPAGIGVEVTPIYYLPFLAPPPSGLRGRTWRRVGAGVVSVLSPMMASRRGGGRSWNWGRGGVGVGVGGCRGWDGGGERV